MPIESYVMPEHELVAFVHTGRVSDEEFLDYYKSFFESDKLGSPVKILVDLRETSSSSRSAEAILQSAGVAEGKLAGSGSSAKVAVVATKDLSFGLARLYEILSESARWEFVVFRAMDTALAWLGLPEDLDFRGDRDDP
jgi:hypothetical protein